MKKLFTTLFLAIFLLSGCLENTQEITLNEKGGGLWVTTTDMAELIGLARQMGSGQELSSLEGRNIDSTLSLALLADSLSGITAAERDIIVRSSFMAKMDMSANMMKMGLRMPFENPDEAALLPKLSGKVLRNVARSQIGENIAAGVREMPDFRNFEDYYDLTITSGMIKRVLNKERYAQAEDDEFLKGMRELSGMGISMRSTYIINLPRPASKAEGKALKLSEDRKRVTLNVDIDDFFDEPEKLQYLIEY